MLQVIKAILCILVLFCGLREADAQSFDTGSRSGTSLLPIYLTSFDGGEQDGYVVLRWTTSDEKDLTAFDIERSSNGIVFETIGSVLPDASRSYHFIDPQLIAGRRFYRLRLNEASGDYGYSNIIRADKREGATLFVYPNPIRNGSLTIESSSATGYTIISMTGHLVAQGALQEGLNKVMLDVAGDYIIRIFSSSGILRVERVTVL